MSKVKHLLLGISLLGAAVAGVMLENRFQVADKVFGDKNELHYQAHRARVMIEQVRSQNLPSQVFLYEDGAMSTIEVKTREGEYFFFSRGNQHPQDPFVQTYSVKRSF